MKNSFAAKPCITWLTFVYWRRQLIGIKGNATCILNCVATRIQKIFWRLIGKMSIRLRLIPGATELHRLTTFISS
jgi:hypothetical protein